MSPKPHPSFTSTTSPPSPSLSTPPPPTTKPSHLSCSASTTPTSTTPSSPFLEVPPSAPSSSTSSAMSHSMSLANWAWIHTFISLRAASLGIFLYFPTLHNTTTKSFREIDNDTLDVPELPPIPGKDMPNPVLDRFDKAYEGFLYMSMEMPKSKGIIINTFQSLEQRALKAIGEGLYFHTPPPIHCVGPLIASADHNEGREEEKQCLAWLDSQPTRSVVFLCFGSLGLFSKEQLGEIAIGLERSEQRFLWVVRSPPLDEQMKRLLVAPPEPTLQNLLPEGFLDRTKDRGLVVKTWAPQVKVLNHESIGGFVTHCGWNSILEALCAGVPMVAWPLYAEQRFNRVVMVEEMKLCLSMEELEGSDGLVSAEEIERKVRQVLMDSQLRERTMKARESAKAALSDGGSSLKGLDELAKSWTS
ncbi:hypothetical protein Syun_018864 [Stephania yunnanensis]|uniref:Glycosyltransferase n=1 Tax=Stephania yunnanensis TaxID=152371 RepID=A0AAP0IUZ4_9MAGN